MLAELRRLEVSHVVGVPDNSSAAGEAFAVASGLWLGGAHPVVLIQNTGLLESGDSLRGTVMRMGVPLLCLVTYRGYDKLSNQDGAQDEMTHADVDSAAVVTEPTLDAWRVSYELYRSADDLTRIARAAARAEAESRPVALLLTRSLV